MGVGSGRTKDSRASWIFLAITGFVMGYTAGSFDSYGILVVVFMEHFNESNTKIGRFIMTTSFLMCVFFARKGNQSCQSSTNNQTRLTKITRCVCNIVICVDI